MVLSAVLIALGLAILIASIRDTYKQTWAYMRKPGSSTQGGQGLSGSTGEPGGQGQDTRPQGA